MRLRFRGVWTLVTRDKNGVEKDRLVVHNLITLAGLSWLTNRLNSGSPPANMSHIGVGTGTTPATTADTTLQTEVLAREAVAKSVVSTDLTDDTMRFTVTVQNADTEKDITELGLFNAFTSGTMFNRAVFTARHLDETDSLDIILDVIAEINPS